MDIFNSNSIEENFPINVCRCCLAEGCYKDISSEYFISGKKEVYEEMLKDVFNVEISYQKYGGPSRYSRLICENCIIKLRDAREFKYKVLASEKSFIKYLDNMQINIKQEENIQETDIISEERAIKVELDVNTDNEVESSENDIFGNSQVVNYYDVLGIKVETEFNIDNEIESHQTLEEQIEENHTDVMGVKLESQLNDDNEIESHETLTDQTDGNHIEIFGNLKLQLNKEFNNISTGGENVCDKRKSTTESNTKSKKPKPADEGTIAEMGKSRAEYMRAYRQKKREEKLKTGKVELKKIARNSTQRSRDYRARVANLILSQTSTADSTAPLSTLKLPSLPFSATMSTSTATACNTGLAEIHPRPTDVEQ
ncbi:unnamed protein product [Parnassius mnemosyne]|uniref:ZAD domain-containing protein n=1 Tax=Parnassius mnemosyne TaxID=213953 RepID=A0AAV1KXP2_9NEOP